MEDVSSLIEIFTEQISFFRSHYLAFKVRIFGIVKENVNILLRCSIGLGQVNKTKVWTLPNAMFAFVKFSRMPDWTIPREARVLLKGRKVSPGILIAL